MKKVTYNDYINYRSQLPTRGERNKIYWLYDKTINYKLCHHEIYQNDVLVCYTITDGCSGVMKKSEYYLNN